MKIRLCCAVILGVILFGICNGAPLDSNEAEARKFVEDISNEIFKFYDDLTNNTIDMMTNKTDVFTGLFLALATIEHKSKLMNDVVGNASLFAKTKYKDEELNYIFNKLIKSTDETIIGTERFFEILLAQSTLEDIATDKDIESYKNESIELAYFPDIQKIYATSNDPEEMKYYWNAWRDKNDKYAMNSFLVLVNGIKDAAKVSGLTAYEFWMKDFNMTQMDAVMTQIEPVYHQLHGFLRRQLNKKYGDAVIDTKGPIPDHLFQQLLVQVWTKGSVIEELFPHKDLPKYDEILTKNNYDTLKLYKMADKFYESMGLEVIPESYWGTQLQAKSEDDEGDCKATILAGSSNVIMQYCHKMDFRTFLQAHGYMAQIHFALEKTDLPAYYSESYNLDYAVGEAIILSASSPKHLAEVGITTNFEFTEEVYMNRLLRLNIHTMLNIPLYYVHTKLMANLFAGKVELTELNKHYWELMDKYVGVEPPSDRVSNSTFDFPIKFYFELSENAQARKFNSEVLSYQLYEKLCSISGQFTKERLQNCDIYGSKVAGDALKKMIKLGTSKPIHEVLATVLPEDPKLNANSLFEYFFPSINWLYVANQQNNVNIGWTHSNKKIESVQLPKVDEEAKDVE